MCLFGTIDVLFPCALLRRSLESRLGRTVVRVAIVGLVLGGLFMSGIVSASEHATARALLQEVTSPFGFYWKITYEGRFVGHPAAPFILAVLLAAAVIGNVRRMARGVAEVVELSMAKEDAVSAAALR
jgi:hypothetical protein